MSSARSRSSTSAGSLPAKQMRPIAFSAVRANCGEERWEMWSTTVVLRLTDPRRLDAARIAVECELDAIDRACSRFRPDAEIARVNKSDGRTVRVSPLLAEVLALALRAARLTDGDVDPTIGSALTLIGYDRDWRLLDRPDSEASAEAISSVERRPNPTVVARAVCGWRNVSFDRVARTVRVPAGFTLDVGATAKAWAADRAAQAAAQAGGCGALVGIGGDIATGGVPPAHGWAVHVTDDHRDDHRAPGQTVTIRSGGLATSSTVVRRWRHRGHMTHHIIDPATGAPVRGTWRTVSVAAASCADANIATTAALVRAGAAPIWLARLSVPARLVSHAGRVYTIGAWPAHASRAPLASTVKPPVPGPDAPDSDALTPTSLPVQ
jgi:thiamine biosynthesis lipoprotein ApbE